MSIKSYLNKTVLITSIILPLLICGCEQHVMINVNEKLPATFSFTGSGTVPFFVLVDLGDEGAEASTSQELEILWKITPDNTKAGTVPLGPITYGVIPTGWTQTVPARGAPPQLISGRTYHAGGPQIEMPDGVVQFRIRDGKIVRLR